MSLTAVVVNITTHTKSLPDKPKIDVVQLSYKGMAYYIETPVGQLTLNQTVNVEASSLDGRGIPRNLQLSS